MKRYAVRLTGLFLLTGILVSLLAGCGAQPGYQVMSLAEGMELVKRESNALLVDVRTEEEYAEKHIPGAILLPIEEIKEGKVEALSDKEQPIFLYCYTGRRAEDSAALLSKFGYTNLYAIGGIIEWDGPVNTGLEP